MKYKFLIALGAFLLSIQLNFFITGAAHASTEGYDMNKIQNTADNVSLDSLGAAAKEYSVPILVITVILSGFLALGGIVFKPLKLAAGSLLGIGILFFSLVNYAPELAGIMISIVDSVMDRITGVN
ncbi:hypothetical protein [Cytobacillus pseudoceanisediminis]|uniref:hypothetical protein n=1 Tax=Cytobacillus pseudoceanisediminis TaxID=3051614 RepID=UPI003C2FCF36